MSERTIYGWRARIGLILPSVNAVMEPEFVAMAPPGVSVHATRVPFVAGTPAGLRQMAEGAIPAAQLVAAANVSVIVWGCTTGSMLKGLAWDEELSRDIEASTGIPAVTTATAVLEALRELKCTRVVVATIYTDEVNAGVKRFLEEAGIAVTQIQGLGCSTSSDVERLTEFTMYSLCRSLDAHEADCVFISCTNAKTVPIIRTLERDLGKPVISSNTATMVAALTRAGVGVTARDLNQSLDRF